MRGSQGDKVGLGNVARIVKILHYLYHRLLELYCGDDGTVDSGGVEEGVEEVEDVDSNIPDNRPEEVDGEVKIV